jgi:hypothetical protein
MKKGLIPDDSIIENNVSSDGVAGVLSFASEASDDVAFDSEVEAEAIAEQIVEETIEADIEALEEVDAALGDEIDLS